MRRLVMVAATIGLPVALSGCSGLGQFLGDTFTLPGANPNMVGGNVENAQRARGLPAADAPLLPEKGDVWPGPPQPFPTLSDVAKEQHDGQGGAQGSALGGPLPNMGNLGHGNGYGGRGNDGSLPSGSSMGIGEDFSGSGSSGGSDVSGGGAPMPAMPRVALPKTPSTGSGSTGGGQVVIPNGDGTETVIYPDGTVKTVPAGKR